MTPTVPAFINCNRCSKPIIDAYKSDRNTLIANVCESIEGSTYLEHVSGLDLFRQEATEKMNAFINDTDDFDDEDNDNNDWE